MECTLLDRVPEKGAPERALNPDHTIKKRGTIMQQGKVFLFEGSNPFNISHLRNQ
jgi:hypothetical protein